MSLPAEVLRTCETLTDSDCHSARDLCSWQVRDFFQVAQMRKINKIWAQGPHPLKNLSWSSQTQDKKLLWSNIFSFCHRWQHNSFQVPGYKILEIFIWLRWKSASCCQPDSLCTSLPQDTPMSSGLGVKFASLWGNRPYSSSPPVVTADSLGDEMSCSSQCACRYTLVSQLSQQAFILVSRDYKLVKQKLLWILGCTPLRSKPNPLEWCTCHISTQSSETLHLAHRFYVNTLAQGVPQYFLNFWWWYFFFILFVFCFSFFFFNCYLDFHNFTVDFYF